LKDNKPPIANASTTTTTIEKKKEEREVSPRPDTGEPSLEKKKEAFSGERVETPSPLYEDPPLPSEEERAANLAKLAGLKRKIGG
jgi:hypothetical protein